MRAAIRALSVGLYGRILTIADFPRRPRYRGVGISDWDGYARRLRRVLDYRNTFLHRRPHLDVTAVPPKEHSQYDFVMAIDVFEHVPPPVRAAFSGVAALLKSGGIVVLSAPYTLDEETVEHFPDMRNYVVTTILGRRCVVYERDDASLVLRSDVAFHGGEGETLEMRIVSRDHILELLKECGFEDIQILADEPDWGIIYDNPCSHTILAAKGGYGSRFRQA